MKVINGFVLREIAGNWLVVPTGNRTVEFNSIISLNKSGSILWKLLETGATEEELVQCIVDEYGIDKTVAAADVADFIKEAEEKGLLVK